MEVLKRKLDEEKGQIEVLKRKLDEEKGQIEVPKREHDEAHPERKGSVRTLRRATQRRKKKNALKCL